ncbi:MAG: hypothetical protein ACLFR2_02865 [Candidatus Kapaibacterium sp.]
MKSFNIGFFLLLLVFAVSCDNSSDSGKDTLQKQMNGKWTRINVDEQDYHYRAFIKFEGNDFMFDVPDTTSNGHTDSFAKFRFLDDDTIEFYDDNDCQEDGIYGVSIKDEELILTAVNDPCTARMLAINGKWGKTLDNQIN